MKISKKKALELACAEYELRNGYWIPLEDDPEWTLEDEVKKDGYDHWIKHPASMIATLRYDGYLPDKAFEKIAGKKLMKAAEKCYWNRDHDT
jgi:hypothetical protein